MIKNRTKFVFFSFVCHHEGFSARRFLAAEYSLDYLEELSHSFALFKSSKARNESKE